MTNENFPRFLFFIILLVLRVYSHAGCGIKERDREELERIHQKEESNLLKRDFRFADFSRDAPFQFPVHFHIFHQGALGNVTDTEIQDGISTINTWFQNKLSFQFFTSTVNRVDVSGSNSSYNVHYGSDIDVQMRKDYHIGNARHLNFYVCNLQDGWAGFSSFPDAVDSFPEQDGIILLNTVLTFNDRSDPELTYSWRNIIAHEVGHWLGLFHTFQGGCSDVYGDYVSDTPAEANPSYYCGSSIDSCPDLPGLDPINNLMDYGNGYCRKNLTNGQLQRIRNQISLYRNVPIGPAATSSVVTSSALTSASVTSSGIKTQTTSSMVSTSAITTFSASTGRITSGHTTSTESFQTSSPMTTNFNEDVSSSTTSDVVTTTMITSSSMSSDSVTSSVGSTTSRNVVTTGSLATTSPRDVPIPALTTLKGLTTAYKVPSCDVVGGACAPGYICIDSICVLSSTTGSVLPTDPEPLTSGSLTSVELTSGQITASSTTGEDQVDSSNYASHVYISCILYAVVLFCI